MKKIILIFTVLHVFVTISCNQKLTQPEHRNWNAGDTITHDVAKANIDSYQKNIKEHPERAVFAINLRSDILRDMTKMGHSIRIFPACESQANQDSTILIVEVYNKLTGSTFYNMAHFFSPKDTLSPDMRSRAVLCPEPPTCPVDFSK